jgi:hypothetical protein
MARSMKARVTFVGRELLLRSAILVAILSGQSDGGCLNTTIGRGSLRLGNGPTFVAGD